MRLNLNLIIVFSILGLIVLALSIYLGILFSQLQKQKKMIEDTRKKAQAKVKDYKESIVMISKATLQGQCDLAEACIRIYNLLTFIDCANDYPITKEYYSEIDQLSILKQRRELTAQDAFKEDKIRFKAEEKYKELFFGELKLLAVEMN